MFKKLINKIFKQKDIECTIDEDTIDCDKLEAPPFECGPGHLTQGYGFFGYTGIPAPVLTPVDEWFASPYGAPAAITQKQQEYQQQEATQRLHDDIRRSSETVESENIHQEMYELATRTGKTTTQLNPIGASENFQGGSENFQT